jgi:hypothetical protein
MAPRPPPRPVSICQSLVTRAGQRSPCGRLHRYQNPGHIHQLMERRASCEFGASRVSSLTKRTPARFCARWRTVLCSRIRRRYAGHSSCRTGASSISPSKPVRGRRDAESALVATGSGPKNCTDAPLSCAVALRQHPRRMTPTRSRIGTGSVAHSRRSGRDLTAASRRTELSPCHRNRWPRAPLRLAKNAWHHEGGRKQLFLPVDPPKFRARCLPTASRGCAF